MSLNGHGSIKLAGPMAGAAEWRVTRPLESHLFVGGEGAGRYEARDASNAT